MRLFDFLLASIVALALNGCAGHEETSATNDFQIDNPSDGIWQDSPEVPFRFVLEQTFGAEEEPAEGMLASINSVVADDEGNVYVLDRRANQIIAFSPNGDFRWRAGREGEGPGEFRNPSSMIWDGSTQLYVSNQQGSRIDIFDLDGQFVQSYPLDYGMSFAQLAGFLDHERIVLTGSTSGFVGEKIAIVSMRNDWTVESQFEINQSKNWDLPGGAMLSAGSSVTISDGAIVAGNMSVYKLEFYDATGQLKRVVTRDMDELVRPGVYTRGGSSSIHLFGGLDTPKEFGKGYRLVTAVWPLNVDDPDAFAAMKREQRPDVIMAVTMDFYDENWRLLYSWTKLREDHPGPLDVWYTDSTGRVYANVDSSYPQIGRYRVDVNPPN